jgi:hypothetical protein
MCKAIEEVCFPRKFATHQNLFTLLQSLIRTKNPVTIWSSAWNISLFYLLKKCEFILLFSDIWANKGFIQPITQNSIIELLDYADIYI